MATGSSAQDWNRIFEVIEGITEKSDREIDIIFSNAQNILREIAIEYDFRDHVSYYEVPSLHECRRSHVKKCNEALLGALAKGFSETISQRLKEIQDEAYKTVLQYCHGHVVPWIIVQNEFLNGILKSIANVFYSIVTFLDEHFDVNLAAMAETALDYLTLSNWFGTDVTTVKWRNQVADGFKNEVMKNHYQIKYKIMEQVKDYVKDQRNHYEEQRRNASRF